MWMAAVPVAQAMACLRPDAVGEASLELRDEGADRRDEAGLDGLEDVAPLELADVGHGERDVPSAPRAPGACASPAAARPAVARSSVVPRSRVGVDPRPQPLGRRARGPPRARPSGAQPSTSLARGGSDSRICTSEPSGRIRASSVTISASSSR